jgi:hypothetical protein
MGNVFWAEGAPLGVLEPFLTKLSTLAAPRQAKPAYAGFGSVGKGRLRLDSSGLNRRKSMFCQSTR